MTQPTLQLQGFQFTDLFMPSGLNRLDQAYLADLLAHDTQLYEQLLVYRQGKLPLTQATSQMLIACGQILDDFMAKLFTIEEAVDRLRLKTLSHQPIFAFKQYYVLRQARRSVTKFSTNDLDFTGLNHWLDQKIIDHELLDNDKELAVALLGQRFLADENGYRTEIDLLVQWCVAAMLTPQGQQTVADWVSFQIPQKLNYENLVDVQPIANDAYQRLQGASEKQRGRDGFKLTDQRMSQRQVMNEVHYCVYCHKNEGDYCSKGFALKKNAPQQGLKISPLGEVLTGCPLDEKISEMHVLKRDGYSIGALAMIMADNPMCPATGHRICNDCMKACIYQKQEPVNIPQVETRCLTDVLELPWGVEIYDLLTRWDPLRQMQWVIKPYNGLKVAVMGMGPAGFTMAHHLLMEGYAVVGMDGLKIEPLPQEWLLAPLHSYQVLQENLDDRVMAGFGGVAEYGITVRWDKNFLKLIYLSLLRRKHFQIVGNVRFGGALTIEDALQMGFDHLVIAVGAGLPRELHVPHSLAPGMRQANDFLMALQLTGAAKLSSLANLQVRMPAIVIGGGLTGIDTATEVQAYYVAQVEKIRQRYYELTGYFDVEGVREKFDAHSLAILDEFLQHAEQIVAERARAQAQNVQPNFRTLLQAWGGVTIVYRKAMQDSPAYQRNHEEMSKAFEEGIYYAAGLEPQAVTVDEYGHVAGLTCRSRILDEEGNWLLTDETMTLPAKSLFVATGAKPNVAYAFEHKGTLQREGFHYQRYDFLEGDWRRVEELGHVKMENFAPFTSFATEQYKVSFIGDTHPVFHGSVVKAIASAKRAYPKIDKTMENLKRNGSLDEYGQFAQQIETAFRANIVQVLRHGPKIIELIVKAPLVARCFHPGQFYRLQNFETNALRLQNTCLQTEALALLGVDHPDDPDYLSFFIFEGGASSRLLATFQRGQEIALMGPTGVRSPLPSGAPQVFLFVGGFLCAVHLLSHGRALRARGHKIIYIALLDHEYELFCQDRLEAIADVIIWLTAENQQHWVKPRPQDRVCDTNVLAVLENHADYFQTCGIALSQVSHVMAIGNRNVLRTLQARRQFLLARYFNEKTVFLAGVHGAMQCMLKGVCAQCLQWQIDPISGERTKAVYSCSWQNQPLEMVDIDNIDERLSQNKMQEILSNLWLEYLFAKYSIPRI